MGKKEIDIKGEKIEGSIFIFGVEDERWICSKKEDAIANIKNHLESGDYETEELSVLELKKTEENEWKISEIGWGELIKDLFKK